MKRKILGTIIGSIMLLTGCTTNPIWEKQKYKIPKYDLKGVAEKRKDYLLSDGSKFTDVVYKVDRNKDGEIDLIVFTSLFYPSKETKPVQYLKILYINDDFDEYFDRILTDSNGDNCYDKKEVLQQSVESVLEEFSYIMEKNK